MGWIPQGGARRKRKPKIRRRRRRARCRLGGWVSAARAGTLPPGCPPPPRWMGMLARALCPPSPAGPCPADRLYDPPPPAQRLEALSACVRAAPSDDAPQGTNASPTVGRWLPRRPASCRYGPVRLCLPRDRGISAQNRKLPRVSRPPGCGGLGRSGGPAGVSPSACLLVRDREPLQNDRKPWGLSARPCAQLATKRVMRTKNAKPRVAVDLGIKPIPPRRIFVIHEKTRCAGTAPGPTAWPAACSAT